MPQTTQKAATVKDAAVQGVQKLGGLTHQHRSTIDARIDRFGDLAVGRLGTRHEKKVATAKAVLRKGLDKLAEQRPDAH